MERGLFWSFEDTSHVSCMSTPTIELIIEYIGLTDITCDLNDPQNGPRRLMLAVDVKELFQGKLEIRLLLIGIDNHVAGLMRSLTSSKSRIPFIRSSRL